MAYPSRKVGISHGTTSFSEYFVCLKGKSCIQGPHSLLFCAHLLDSAASLDDCCFPRHVKQVAVDANGNSCRHDRSEDASSLDPATKATSFQIFPRHPSFLKAKKTCRHCIFFGSDLERRTDTLFLWLVLALPVSQTSDIRFFRF
jgi:hypothetical protein